MLSTHPTGEGALSTCSYLYGENSDVMETLTNPENDLVLNTQDSDHIKLLADISLQLSNEQLQALSQQSIADDRFEYLGNWVCWERLRGNAKLKDLLRHTKSLNIYFEQEDSNILLKGQLDKLAIDSALFSELAQKLRACWWEVGYLMGVSPLDIATIREEYTPDLCSYQLLCQWQRRNDNEATYGTLFKAVHRMFRYRPIKVNDAHNFCVCHVNNQLLPTPPPLVQD